MAGSRGRARAAAARARAIWAKSASASGHDSLDKPIHTTDRPTNRGVRADLNNLQSCDAFSCQRRNNFQFCALRKESEPKLNCYTYLYGLRIYRLLMGTGTNGNRKCGWSTSEAASLFRGMNGTNEMGGNVTRCVICRNCMKLTNCLGESARARSLKEGRKEGRKKH